jgi:hypothetical protein
MSTRSIDWAGGSHRRGSDTPWRVGPYCRAAQLKLSQRRSRARLGRGGTAVAAALSRQLCDDIGLLTLPFNNLLTVIIDSPVPFAGDCRAS